MIIKILFSVLFNASVVLYTLIIFRRELKNSLNFILLSGLTMGLITYFGRFITESPLFLLQTMLGYVILLTLLKRLPVFFSFVMAFYAMISYFLIETLIFVPAIQWGLTSLDALRDNLTHYMVSHTIMICIFLSISLLSYRWKWFGFAFLKNRFRSRELVKPHNFLWCSTLVIIAGIMQFFVIEMDRYSSQLSFIVIVIILVVIAVVIANRENKKALYARYGSYQQTIQPANKKDA